MQFFDNCNSMKMYASRVYFLGREPARRWTLGNKWKIGDDTLHAILKHRRRVSRESIRRNPRVCHNETRPKGLLFLQRLRRFVATFNEGKLFQHPRKNILHKLIIEKIVKFPLRWILRSGIPVSWKLPGTETRTVKDCEANSPRASGGWGNKSGGDGEEVR